MDDHDHGSETSGDERVTSPMQAFGSSEVAIGFLVFFVGFAVTFVLPLALA